MGIKFNDAEGKAKKGADIYAFKDGEQSLRLFGDIMPRYLYWVKSKDGKDMPIECLSFDRKEERFTNVEKDWVREYFPEVKCGWAYAINGIDLKENKVVVVNLKKKLFEQIKNAAEDLGDPTDPENGWDVVFKRQKTGSLAFNVEYTLQVLRCKKRAVTAEEKEMMDNAKPIDVTVPRLTSDEQKAFIEKYILGGNEEDTPEEMKPTSTPGAPAFEEADDIPA
jgi:hypothetical protein